MLEAGIGCFNQKYLKAFKCVALVGPDRNAHIFQIILYFSRDLGKKMYELSNHLGNVLTTVSEIKLTADGNTDGVVDSYAAVITSAQDYYPFGSLEPDRTFSSDNYRFGFNGKENDNEVKGTGNQQDYGMRIYDPRIARFLSVDPISKKYPELTPYQFASNSPIVMIDVDGLEGIVIHRVFENCRSNSYTSTVSINQAARFGIYIVSDRLHCTGGHKQTDTYRIPESGQKAGFTSTGIPTLSYFYSTTNGKYESNDLGKESLESFTDMINQAKDSRSNKIGSQVSTKVDISYQIEIDGESFSIKSVRNETSEISNIIVDSYVIIQASNNSQYIQDLTASYENAGYTVIFEQQSSSFSGNINVNDSKNSNGINVVLSMTVSYDTKYVRGKESVQSVTHDASGTTISPDEND